MSTDFGLSRNAESASASAGNTFDLPADRTTLYRHLGAHIVDGGVRFAVWAPNAQQVSVISDGNGWTPGRDWLRSSDTGTWEGFVAGAVPGTRYKYAINTTHGQVIEKADPFAFHSELRPGTASVICSLRHFQWHDSEWIQQRDSTNWLEAPVSVYELHLGSWKRPKDGREFHNYRELAHQLTEYIVEAGYTHVQLMPVTEHPFDGSWGISNDGLFFTNQSFRTASRFSVLRRLSASAQYWCAAGTGFPATFRQMGTDLRSSMELTFTNTLILDWDIIPTGIL